MLTASVIVCTYTEERWCDSLKAIESVQSQQPAPLEVIVVVDYNPELQRRFHESLHGVRVVPNCQSRGLSGARNTGVEFARGDIVVFLDDDAFAHPGWLAAIVDPYKDPRVLGVGGRAEPVWTVRRPQWWPAEYDWVVGCTYVGLEPGVVRNVIGSNASFRRELFQEDRFACNIGRTSQDQRPLGCEETEFCIRAKNANPEGFFLFDDRAVVGHRVPATRQSFAYFRSRCFAEGLSKARVTKTVGTKNALATEGRYVAATLPAGVIQGVRSAASGEGAGLLRACTIIIGLLYTGLGYLQGLTKRALP